MARVTARQAFTRSKTRRMKGRADFDGALLEAKRRYVRQLSSVGIQVEGGSQSQEIQNPVAPRRSRVRHQSSATKKITDYFPASRSLEFSPRIKQPLKTSVCRDPNGIECVTIHDSDTETEGSRVETPKTTPDDNYGDENKCQNNNVLSSCDTSVDSTSEPIISGQLDTSSECGNSSKMTVLSSTSGADVKPHIAKLDFRNLGVSFGELELKIRVADDIEIVDILPPIPLRKHEVYEIDGEEENEQERSLC